MSYQNSRIGSSVWYWHKTGNIFRFKSCWFLNCILQLAFLVESLSILWTWLTNFVRNFLCVYPCVHFMREYLLLIPYNIYRISTICSWCTTENCYAETFWSKIQTRFVSGRMLWTISFAWKRKKRSMLYKIMLNL